MLAYVLRRLVIAIVAIFVLATITFFLLRVVPGDPFAGPRVTHRDQGAAARALRARSKPLLEQYLIYMANLAQGDFGYSLSQRGPRVNDIICDGVPGLARPRPPGDGPRHRLRDLVRHRRRAEPRQALRLPDRRPRARRHLGPELRARRPLAVLPGGAMADPAGRALRDLRRTPSCRPSPSASAPWRRSRATCAPRMLEVVTPTTSGRPSPRACAGARSSGATRSATPSSRSSPSSARSSPRC